MFAGQQLVMILSALYNQDRTALEVVEAVERSTKGKVRIPRGSIYTQLDRLTKEGLLRSFYGEEQPAERGGRRRRYYSITLKGRRVADQPGITRVWSPGHAY